MRSSRESTISLMEPVTATITTVLSIARPAGEISKKLFELGKRVKDREIKQQIDEIADQLRELKQSASELEDQNRELREKLRFKSDDYVFRNPFWYEKAHPDQPLCAKCHASNIAAPMSEIRSEDSSLAYRACLVCHINVMLGRSGQRYP